MDKNSKNASSCLGDQDLRRHEGQQIAESPSRRTWVMYGLDKEDRQNNFGRSGLPITLVLYG